MNKGSETSPDRIISSGFFISQDFKKARKVSAHRNPFLYVIAQRNPGDFILKAKDVITVARGLQAYLFWAQGEEIREEVKLAQAAGEFV